MKQYSAAELAEIIELHHSFLRGEENGKRADLSSADLSSANLRSADLRYADLSSADLSSADLSSADLRYADLSYADLSYANLRSADLSSANLRSANLRSADLRYADLSYANLRSAASIQSTVGNMQQLKTIQCDYWTVAYTNDQMQIGCQRHTIDEWWAFTEVEISRMDSHAVAWWSVWKPILQTIIETSPATKSEYAA